MYGSDSKQKWAGKRKKIRGPRKAAGGRPNNL